MTGEIAERELDKLVVEHDECKALLLELLGHYMTFDFDDDHPGWASARRLIEEARAERDALRARAKRLHEMAVTYAALTTMLVDLLSDEQLNSPAYPDDLDRRSTIAHKVCWEAGDITDLAEPEATR